MSRIVYVASEANPYAASGGLGDVMGALPVTLAENYTDNEVSVILPLYTNKMKSEFKSKLVKVKDISFRYSWRDSGATVYKIKNGRVDYYFIENHYYFDRGALYGEYDDAERFAFFSMAVLEFLIQSNYKPDIIHANDWQTALTVIYLKTKYSTNEMLERVKTVYTIHNIEYQGKFDKAILGDIFALDGFMNVVEYDGCINLMKGALCVTDFITTVSPNYANELHHNFFAFGLADIISKVGVKLKGVINGIDYKYFSPESGGEIYSSYDIKTVFDGKAENKAAVQKELGLEVNPKIPLVVMITRLASQKGIDLIKKYEKEKNSNYS